MIKQPIKHDITAEFLEQACGYEAWEDAKDDIEMLAERFEKTYSATVEIHKTRIGGYRLLITPSRAAYRETVYRGTQEFFYWLDND